MRSGHGRLDGWLGCGVRGKGGARARGEREMQGWGEKTGRERKKREKGPRDLKKRKKKDLDARWEGVSVKTGKERRVAAKHRGWEQKKPGENPRV